MIVEYSSVSVCLHVTPAGTGGSSSDGPRVDAAVQADLVPAASLLPPDSSAPHPDLLAAAGPALTAAGRISLGQHLREHQQAAAVLAGLSAWLPQELVDAATAAAAAGAADGGAEGSAGAAGPAAAGHEGDAAAAGSSGSVVSGVSLWREEARVAGSVVELVTELEERWRGVLDQLEQAQVG